MPDIRDITDAGSFIPEPSQPWYVWLSLILGGIILLTLIIWLIKRPKANKQSAKSNLKTATNELQALQANSSEIPPHEVATELSLIIRRYLSSSFNDLALFETNEELTLRKSALNQLNTESKQHVSEQLTELSQLKYVPAKNPRLADMVQEHIEQAGDLLTKIEHELTAPPTSTRTTSQS